ncbi:MAG: 2-oxo acid dehydrogenase subunit E2, partial [Gaiellales bacterium]
MTDRSDSLNDGFVQLMYENWLANPASVSEEWQTLFRDGGAPDTGQARAATATIAPPAPPPPPAAAAATPPPAAAAKKPAADTPDGAKLLKGPDGGLVRNMNASLTVPTATTFRNIAMATIDAKRRALNAKLADSGRKLSFTHIIAWALIEGYQQVPVMGHTFEEINGKPYRIPHEHVNFGLAVDVEKPDGSRGLMVPCVQNADTLGATGFFDAYDELVAKSRTGKLGLEDMIGTTFTLTNPGGLGTVASVPRLMKGQGTIIATGAINFPVEYQHLSKERIAELGVSKVMVMTSTYDHRVIQGAESGRFLNIVDKLLQGEDGFYERIADALAIGDGSSRPAPAAPPAEPAAPKAAAAAASDGPAPVLLEPGAGMVPVHHEMLPEPTPFPKLPNAKIVADDDQLASVAAAMSLVKAFRTHGHLAANLDPLGSKPIGDPALDPETVGLTDEIMRTIPAKVLRVGVAGETFADALPVLREKYCGTIAYEIEHIANHEHRVWLRRMIEAGEHRQPLDSEQKTWLLERLTEVETFERFVRRAYLAQKQFSIEGLDM